MLGRPVLLAIDKRADRPGLATIRSQIDRLREGSGLPVLYATGALASYERKRLIEQKVPFVFDQNRKPLGWRLNLDQQARNCPEEVQRRCAFRSAP